ncbi:MAG: acetate--CoA ligase [Bacteroidota bacterium]|jgi:acetyl-CoA synthetase
MHYPSQLISLESRNQAYRESLENPEEFWANVANDFTWKRKWDRVLDWNFEEPNVRWFDGAQLNITENCLDRHLPERGDEIALIWESNSPNEESKKYTFTELHEAVCVFAEVLRKGDMKKGDRVCIYMGMVPELAIAVLACARVGAIHSVIFGGFSAHSVADRVNDAQASAIITCDGAYRGAKDIQLKSIIDEALEHCSSVKTVWVYERTDIEITLTEGRDVLWKQAIAHVNIAEALSIPAETMEAEDPLFILYTSGSTGKPKGVVHTCGGYMVWTHYTFTNAFQYQRGWVHFCTADIGWITGHSYILYGPLTAGATTLLFEGIPTYPNPNRFWEIVEKHNVNILYTAPTAIRSLMSAGDDWVMNHKMPSLKVLGTVGEPINEEAWQWYHKMVGKGNCEIVDTWWQTETGGVLITNLAGVTPSKPTYATLPLPGVEPLLVDENGKEILGNKVSGNLCIRKPWPGILRTTWGDHERCKQTYFSTYPGLYFTGDGALRDENGYYRITGRVDDILNVSGHRIGTAEVENAINLHTGVIESAIVGYPHDIKGQGIYAFVIYQGLETDLRMLSHQINETVSREIGAIAKADKIQIVSGLPKTRSGKIMRRILRKIAEGELESLGDTSTLLDPSVVESIIEGRL